MLDRQLEAGIELLRQAHQAQVRALEMVWMTNPAAQLPPRLAGVPEVAEQPVPPPSPAPERRPRREAWTLYNEVSDALDKLGPEFVRADICRALGYDPERSSLQRTLRELASEGLIKLAEEGSGRIPSRWVKVAQADAANAHGS